jgi:hypothetical protein
MVGPPVNHLLRADSWAGFHHERKKDQANGNGSVGVSINPFLHALPSRRLV